MSALARKPNTVADLPARKPLYLSSPPPAQVDAGTDHLMVRRAAGALLRFPVARVCRIICNKHLNWSGAALSLCLSKGIPITWVDGHGRALGSSQSRFAQPETFSTMIETYLELPNWQHRFANWLARRRLETLTTCARRAVETGHGLDAAQFAELKRDYVYNGTYPSTFDSSGEGWCHALVVDRLHRDGLHSCYWGFDATLLDLASELSALLWAELNLDCGSIVSGAERDKLGARMFEAWARQRETRLLHHLGDLKRHLTREISTWH